MPQPQPMTEAQIRQLAPDSYARGWEYYRRGAVLRVTQRGDELSAEVQGSDYEPYSVFARLGPDGVAMTACTCPYTEEWGGVCKHVVALLLVSLHRPEQVEHRAALADLLADLDAAQLRQLFLEVGAELPGLAEAVEQALGSARAAPAATADQPLPPPELSVVRQEVRAALHSLDRMRASEAYWHVGGVVREVESIAGQATRYLEAGDGRSALEVLEAVTDAYVAEWFELDDSDGEAGEFFEELGRSWTEALLSADLQPAERQQWVRKLLGWQREAEDYGIDRPFDVACAAAQEGWDDPRLQRVLRGTAGGAELWAGSPPWYADELIAARLRVLERQGRTEEYLNLARAAGQALAYSRMLVQLGRSDEALAVGLREIATADEALLLAQALDQHGATDAALEIGARGLTLASSADPAPMLGDDLLPRGGRLALGRWLRDRAQAAGRPDLALEAALVAVRSSAELVDYQAAQTLAGPRWAELRPELLGHIRAQTSFFQLTGVVDILLYEELFDEAIAVAEAHPGFYALAEQVADAVVRQRPAWVFASARQHAERIIGEVKADRYVYAAQWLERARDAARVLGQEGEWRAYVEQLLDQHRRKIRLTPLLQELLGVRRARR